jgi:hypothetical protein
LRDEAELAGVLAHELGHQLADQLHRRIVDSMRGLDRYDPEFTRELIDDRDDEIQADELAMLLAARAGYDPRAFETALRAVAADDSEDADDLHGHVATHPRWAERIARAQALAMHLPAGGERAAARFREHAARIAVGDDPRKIAIVGGAVVIARWRVAIDVAGARLDEHAAKLELDGADVEILPIGAGLAPYVRSYAKGEAADLWTRGSAAILVWAKGANARRVTRKLVGAVRAARADELSAVQPHFNDVDAPRVLWPERAATSKPRPRPTT